MKAVVAAFNKEKALVGAFSVIVQLSRLIANSYSGDRCTVQCAGVGEKSYLRGCVCLLLNPSWSVSGQLAAACDGRVMLYTTLHSGRGQDIIAHIATSRCYELSVRGAAIHNNLPVSLGRITIIYALDGSQPLSTIH